MKKRITAAEMGKLGGSARARALTPERRKEIATAAAVAMHAKRKREKEQ